jgi:hypothetical protein
MTITIPLKSFLLVVTGIIIGAAGGILIVWRPVSKSELKFLNMKDGEDFLWCSGDTVYLRNHGDTTFLEDYYHGSNQKYPDHIRILTGLPTMRLQLTPYSHGGTVH